MEAVRLKVSRYIYCHRQSVSVIGDSLSRLDGKKIWKHCERTFPWEGSGGVRCDRESQSFWRDKKRNNGVRQTCYLDMSSIVTCFLCKEPYMKLCGVRQRSCVRPVNRILHLLIQGVPKNVTSKKLNSLGVERSIIGPIS